jgi:hypothetical protein
MKDRPKAHGSRRKAFFTSHIEMKPGAELELPGAREEV